MTVQEGVDPEAGLCASKSSVQDQTKEEPTADEVVVLSIDLPGKHNPSANKRGDESKEKLLMRSGVHVSSARVQRGLYREKVVMSKEDVRNKKPHSQMRRCLAVDFGQNMELPKYGISQPGVTYYWSPLTVNNLGIVDHAYEYPNGDIKSHMYTHVYHEGVGKKGANNVASLMMKTIHHMGILQEDNPGEELNVIFDNCTGQKK